MVSDEALKSLRKAGIALEGLKYPKHIAFSFTKHKKWAKKNEKDLEAAYAKMFSKINEVVELQAKYDIPIMTVYLLTSKVQASSSFDVLIDQLQEFFEQLAQNKSVFDNKMKVSILGKWYDLPGRVIEPIKKIIDETRDYDHYFLNLCINYDGQEEIVDACKLILRRILADKADVDNIDIGMIKDNIYSSYFLPPDVILKMGGQKALNGFLLWDSTRSVVYFTDVHWQDLDEKEFLKSIKYYQDNKN